ncbi:MAG: hypothetical protein AAB372_02715 [Patescibacteria group bacterium]
MNHLRAWAWRWIIASPFRHERMLRILIAHEEYGGELLRRIMREAQDDELKEAARCRIEYDVRHHALFEVLRKRFSNDIHAIQFPLQDYEVFFEKGIMTLPQFYASNIATEEEDIKSFFAYADALEGAGQDEWAARIREVIKEEMNYIDQCLRGLQNLVQKEQVGVLLRYNRRLVKKMRRAYIPRLILLLVRA